MPVLAQEATAEGRIFNEIAGILIRQRTEHIEPQLRELREQLLAVYNGPRRADVNFATCQIGLALSAFGLGDHDEAMRQASNALKNGAGQLTVMINAQMMYANMGEFALARKTAAASREAFAGDFEALQISGAAFVDCLDFDAGIDCLEQMAKLAPPESLMVQIKGGIAFLSEMSSAARFLKLTADDLMERASCVVDVIRAAGHKIYWVELAGHRPGASTLQFFVDADPDICADLTFAVAEALTSRYAETAVDLVTMAVRTHEGVLVTQASNVLELVS